MKLCQVRCSVLDMETQGIAHLLNEWKIVPPPKNTLGVSYDDFTICFIKNKSNIIKEDDCK